MVRPRIWRGWWLALVVVPAAVAWAGDGPVPPLEAVPDLDLQRYSGRWHEIARYPNWFQKGCDRDVVATYTPRADGKVAVVNECVKADGSRVRAEGLARRADRKGPASRLEVRFAPRWLSFLPFVWGKYWVLELAPDYSHALVGDPSREYLWILAREPALNQATYDRLLERVRALGFDPSRLQRTRQTGAEEPGLRRGANGTT